MPHLPAAGVAARSEAALRLPVSRRSLNICSQVEQHALISRACDKGTQIPFSIARICNARPVHHDTS